MFSLDLTNDRDDPRFIDLVARIITGAVVMHGPPEARVFKIDHWFDHKWLAFSGKTLGALGVWSKRLTVPPFVANRIIDQWLYLRDKTGASYRCAGPGPNIHHCGPAAENLCRRVEQVAPASALFWFSGDTAATGRGSLMGYIPVERDYWSWFLAFTRDDAWRVVQRKKIHDNEVRLFQETCEGLVR